MKKVLWLIWKSSKNDRKYKIGELMFLKGNYYFNYLNDDLLEAKQYGFICYPGFEDLSKEYVSNKLFANIETRLPNCNRPDYIEILNYYNLDTVADNMDILTLTKGKLITDNYEFVKPFDKTKIEFEIAGTRYSKDLKKCKNQLHVNGKLILEIEENNKHDKYAVKVLYPKNNRNYHIGYVPKYYSKELRELLKENVNYSAMIKSFNLNNEINDEFIVAKVKLIFC